MAHYIELQRFNIGDVVKYIGTSKSWLSNQEHIITKVIFDTHKFQYGTNHGAWFSNRDFKLIRKADQKSLQFLRERLLNLFE